MVRAVLDFFGIRPKEKTIDDIEPDLKVADLYKKAEWGKDAGIYFPHELARAIINTPEQYAVAAKEARRKVTNEVTTHHRLEGIAVMEGGWRLPGAGEREMRYVYDRFNDKNPFAIGMKLVRVRTDDTIGIVYLNAATDLCNRLIQLYQERPWEKKDGD